MRLTLLCAAACLVILSGLPSWLKPSVLYAVNLPDGFKTSDAPPLAAASPTTTGDTSPRCSTPSVTSRCFYMDYRDGTEKWELSSPARFGNTCKGHMTPARHGRYGSLRSRASGTVRGVAALEPGIEPFNTGRTCSRGAVPGVATPSSKANPDKIRASGLQIYRDCGDEDMFLLFEGS